MKSNDTNNKDNFTVFLSCSIALHLLLLYCCLFSMPSLFEKLPEDQTITFEMLPVSEKPNIITQMKQKEAPIENEDAKKSEQTKPKEEKPKDFPKEDKVKETEVKKVEEKPKIEEKKLIEKPKEKKKQESKTDELDSLLKNLEQSSEGDNVKSNKHKRLEQVDNKKEAKGVDKEGLPLSDSESSLIKRQIERHWNNIPAGARGNNKVKIIIIITLDKAGNVEQAKVKEKICPNIPASVCEALADSAVRAVWKAGPIENLDPTRFNHWQKINFNFDPSRL